MFDLYLINFQFRIQSQQKLLKRMKAKWILLNDKVDFQKQCFFETFSKFFRHLAIPTE